MYHLQEVLDGVTTHHVLKNLPATSELCKRHKLTETTLKQYEDDMVAIWMNQHVPKYILNIKACRAQDV